MLTTKPAPKTNFLPVYPAGSAEAAALRAMGVEAIYLYHSFRDHKAFVREVIGCINDTVKHAYKEKGGLTPKHLPYLGWAVMLRRIAAPQPRRIIAACCVDFITGFRYDGFNTAFEAVHPEWQRQGFGTMLMRAVEAVVQGAVFYDPQARDWFLGKYDLVPIEAHVDFGDLRASDFVRRLGYRQVGAYFSDAMERGEQDSEHCAPGAPLRTPTDLKDLEAYDSLDDCQEHIFVRTVPVLSHFSQEQISECMPHGP